MAAITIQCGFVAVSSGFCVKVFFTKSGDIKLLDASKITEVSNTDGKMQKKLDDRTGRILSMKFSPCAKYFAACSDKKELVIWKTCDWKVLNSRIVNRQASQLCFTQNLEILVADRSGDVYLHSLNDITTVSQPVMGRVSLLLDLIVTPDGKFLLTCDRDEKICVSHFPNCYNIQSFCLGHSEFVTSVNILPSQSQVLVSSSGDGTVRFWDYVKGTELLCINTSNESVDSKSISARTKRPNEPSAAKDAIKKCICTSDKNIVIVLYFSSPDIQIYAVNISNDTSTSSNFSHQQTLTFTQTPFDIALDESQHLWVVQPVEKQPIVTYKLTSNEGNVQFISDESLNNKIESLNSNWEFFKDALSTPSDLSMMFKQWFDNVGDYLQRKEERLQEKQNKKQKFKQ